VQNPAKADHRQQPGEGSSADVVHDKQVSPQRSAGPSLSGVCARGHVRYCRIPRGPERAVASMPGGHNHLRLACTRWE
jgi:hypothetical protein